jgi:DNA-binding transcriptional MerR regulator
MFKIGEFSRLSRVSVRMLRHYDRLELLKPMRTDPRTSYRYYSADQLPRLNRILALRDLGFSLEQISGMLDDNVPADHLLDIFKRKRAEIERQMQVEKLRLKRLEARIQEMRTPSAQNTYDVILREIEPQLVAGLRRVVSEGDALQSMFEQLERYVNPFGARADRPPLSIYHDRDYHETQVDTEVVVPLKFEIPGDSEIRVYELAEIPHAACVVHTGGYGTIYQAYNALLAWIETNRYRMSGPIREVYLRFGADGLEFELPPTYLVSASTAYVTELQLPVDKIIRR